jgi:hypothetical protein
MEPGSSAAGGGGELVASGVSPATMTRHRRVCGFRIPCYFLVFEKWTVTVRGVSVSLPPGTYWVGVAPVVEDAA